jgi:hypothetical protein
MTCCSQGYSFQLDNTWETGMPLIFPTYSSTYQLIRSRWWKKANQCLGEESYTMSDPRIIIQGTLISLWKFAKPPDW